jgi:peptidoglycan/LPS O-acetylase OafA/YrhL
MSASVGMETSASRRPRCPALSGVRIFAALHIYIFHLKQAHDAGVLTFSAFDRLPGPVALLIGRGYISTGFFFQLSGFLLAYVYLAPSGRLRSSTREFLKGRFVRLYPLYLLSLLLLAPAPALLPFTAKNASPAELATGIATSLTLTQAWFPKLAIWWNAPAWALSAFATFYVLLPTVARLTAPLGRRGLMVLIAFLTLCSWLPAAAYLAIDPAGDAWTATPITLGGSWLNALRFNPLTWLPQFLSGVILGRLFARNVDLGTPRANDPGAVRPSFGDAVALGILVFVAFFARVPYVALRHGLLAPLSLIVITDLARGRGLLARLLAWPGFGRLSETSFSLFALQMPAGVWFCVAFLRTPHGSTIQLLGVIGFTLATAVLWAEVAQKTILERLRPGKSGNAAEPQRTRPHFRAISVPATEDVKPLNSRPL